MGELGYCFKELYYMETGRGKYYLAPRCGKTVSIIYWGIVKGEMMER